MPPHDGFALICPAHGETTLGPDHARCHACGSPVGIRYARPLALPAAPLNLWRFADWLPIATRTPVSLGEGGTPLLAARGDHGCRLWFKDESRNPTGSQKDRALAVAVAAARERGLDSIVLASAGSTGLAAAAYAARADLRCVVLAPGDTPDGRIQPLLLYGARVVRFPGPIDDALALLERVRAAGLAMEVSTTRLANPFQAEAPRTIAFEIASQLGHAPDWCLVPTGGGGTLSGIGRGFQELAGAGITRGLPRLVAIQPAAYHALALALAAPGRPPRTLATRDEPPTVLNKLAHSFPPDGEEALALLRATGGTVVTVSDEEALAARADLGRQEGLFVEPSAAAGLAGLRQLVAQGRITATDSVVVVLTGGGFRELGTLPPIAPGAVATMPATDGAAWLSALLAEGDA